MKRKISIALLLVFTMICASFAFTSCGGNGEKQVPVYQGMTITDNNTATLSFVSAPYRTNGIMMLSSNNGNADDNGNHNGHYKGDHTDRNDAIDEENPYPDNAYGENIEEEIKSSLDVIGSPDTIYYAEPNQDIYINIHIDNPDSFEIMSFTLNGKKYSSYMFEEGSDMETIVLKYNVGDAAGIVEYTIDAIKYIDGTEIKDVIIDGNKTVMAGVKTQNQVSANISGVDIGTNSLTFNANIKDNNALVEFSKGALKAVLYDGFGIVAEKDLAVGDNSVTFDNLKTNTLYQYAVVGYYDNLSGDGFKMNVLYKDAFYTDSVVLFDNITVGQENISFSFLWHEDHQGKAISTLKLYKENSYIKNVTESATSISELLSDTTYKLVAEYSNGDKTESISIEFTTLAKATPEISVISPTKTQTSVGFEIIETDADGVGAVTKIELVHASGTVVADSLDQRTFANLLSNNSYTIKVTYVYDLNNGEGEQTITKELAITTEAKTAPSFTVKNESVTTSSITAEYAIADGDNILSEYKIELYKGTALVLENTDKEIDFTGLSYYTDYTVKFTYTYDLNDGNGEQTVVYDFDFKTLPYVDVTECSIANTSAVSEGETIFMSLKLDNPLGMTIESVVINGETYGITGASTKNKIFVEIICNGQFAGGDTYFKIDKVNAKIDNTTLSVKPESELSDNVFINGKLEVIKIEYVNDKFEPIDWAFPSDKVYVLITLDNPTGYYVDGVNTDITNLIKIDNNRWYYQVSTNTDWNVTYLSGISYHNQFLEKTISYSDIKTECYVVKSNETTYISDANGLKNMQDGYYYELTNDIDLSNLEWIGSDLKGVLNGKGYSIKNMSFVGSVKNANAYLGLFKQGSGVIQNLNIENATIIADVIQNDKNDYDAYCGAFVASPKKIIISDCSVDEYSTFGIVNTTKASVYVGGFVGIVFYGEIVIKDSISLASVSASCAYAHEVSGEKKEHSGGFIGLISHYSSAGFLNCISEGSVNGYYTGGYIGFVGDYAYVGDTRVFIFNSISSGMLEGDYVGGFFGMVNNNSAEYKSSLLISDCINNSTITANRIGGGIAGTVASAETMISGCISIGNIIPKSSEALISYSVCEILNEQNGAVLENCYSIQLTENNKFESCTEEQLNSKAFYTETLGWSEDVWDFSELDVENGKYPKLK